MPERRRRRGRVKKVKRNTVSSIVISVHGDRCRWGDHIARYKNVNSLYCTPDITNNCNITVVGIISYTNYT